MRSFHSFLAREHRVLERMHEIIQKGMDSLTQRLDNDLKDDCSRILVPIGYIKGLCNVGGMNLIDLCVLFVKIFELIRSQFQKQSIPYSSLSFMDGVISSLNKQICLYKKLK
ncbi:hypothetical protein VN0420_01440 [Helicobacter pylori]|nr:hypothetical protein VN0420_01440 [Helicobacter pylori]